MLTKHSDLYVCVDCYLQHEAGEVEDTDPSWSVEKYNDGLLSYAGLQIVSGDSDKELEFSVKPCDICGSTLGGTRNQLVALEEVSIEPFTRADHAKVLGAYIEAAFWSSTDSDGEPLDSARYADCELADEARAELTDDVTHFLHTVAERFDVATLPALEQLGHDLWLTRNRHGAGFWDRGLGALGTELTSIAHQAGERDLVVGDDGKVHTL